MASELEDLRKKADRLNQERKYEQMLSLLNDDVLNRHEDAFLYRRRGDAWYGKREYEKAIADYSKAIELKPDDFANYNNRGNAWHKNHEYDKALADYNHALELNPDFNIYYNRGNVWFSMGEYQKSIADNTKAIEMKPDHVNAHINRGNAWHNIGEYAKAIADYNKAIRLQPDYADSYYTRGNSWRKKGEYEKAIADHVRYLELTPDKADIWAERAKSSIEELTKLLNDKKLKEIVDVINDIKKILLFDSGRITHYTGLSVAKLLLLDGSPFRISEGAFLNDTSEGRELFKFLELKFTSERGINDTVAEPFAQKPFIGSFVEDTKHDDLNLWRMYGKENKEEAKGCALTIRAGRFIRDINYSLETASTSPHAGKMTAASDDINLYRVAYRLTEEPNRFIVPGLKENEEKKLTALLMRLKSKVKEYHTVRDNKKDLEEYINSIAFLFKSDVYRSENELRLVVKGVGFEKKIDKDLPVPRVYINLVNIRPMVENITLGPKVERPDEWASAFYYSYDKQDKKPDIFISHLPFK